MAAVALQRYDPRSAPRQLGDAAGRWMKMRRICCTGLVVGLAVIILPASGSDLRTMRRADGVILIYSEGLDDPATLSPPLRPPSQPAPAPSEDRLSENLSAAIDRLARRQNLDPGLVRAVIRVESDFDARAVSSRGARGLMQLMPSTARQLGVHNVFDPVQNVRGGTEYLRRMIDRFDGNLELGLASYNAGPGAVDRYGGVPPFRETTRYIHKVLRAYRGETGGSTRSGASSLPRLPVRVVRTATDEVLITTETSRR